MSYKFSTGSLRQGDIYYEDDRTGDPTYIDFGMDTITLRPSGAAILHAEEGRVGINTTDPDYTLDVAGDIGVDQYIYHNGDGNTLINFADDKIILKAGGKAMVTMEEKGSAPHEVTINDGSNNIDFVVKGNGSNAGNPGMKFDASTNKLGINGVGTPSYELDVAGDIGLSEYIYHKGDDDTFIRLQDDSITVKAGNVNFIELTEDDAQDKLVCNEGRDDVDFIVRSPNESLAVYLNAGNEVFHINHGESNFKTKIHSLNGEVLTVNDAGAIFNEDGAAGNDFRVESDTNTHMLFIDATTNLVGIGTANPSQVLDVNGNIRVANNGNIYCSGSGELYLGNTAGGVIRVGGDGGTSTALASFNHLSLQTTRDEDDIFIKTGASTTTRLFVEGDTGNIAIGTAAPGSTLDISGSVSFNVTSFGANASIDGTHYTCIGNCGPGGANNSLTLTLPSATDAMTGRVYVFKRADTGGSAPGGSALVVARNSAYIDGGTDNLELGNGDCITIQCVGQSSGWIVLGNYVPI